MQQRRVDDELRHPHQHVRIRRQPYVLFLDADRRVGPGPAQVDGAQRVERGAKRNSVHGSYHQLGDARRCANHGLDVAKMGARAGLTLW
jgi:hypothetical protein